MVKKRVIKPRSAKKVAKPKSRRYQPLLNAKQVRDLEKIRQRAETLNTDTAAIGYCIMFTAALFEYLHNNELRILDKRGEKPEVVIIPMLA